MTRDAALPLLSVLVLAQEQGATVANLFEGITPKRYGDAGLVDMDDFDDCQKVTSLLADPKFEITRYFSNVLGFATVDRVDLTDGVRIYFENGEVAHVRGSGNAPQLRIYSLANTQKRARMIVDECVKTGGVFDKIASI